MPSVFTAICDGSAPARFVWRDDVVVAFLTIAPIAAGHTLVVPRLEIDDWTDAPVDVLGPCMEVARAVGCALKRTTGAPRVGLVIAGFDVPHLHLHVFPAWSLADFDFRRVDTDPDPVILDRMAEQVRSALRSLGHGEWVPPPHA